MFNVNANYLNNQTTALPEQNKIKTIYSSLQIYGAFLRTV